MSNVNVDKYDIVIVGAGIGGLYGLYKLRQAGFSVRVIDQAPEVGGTWYWNRYPGAKCDIESWDYSYSFSEELQQEWVWTQRFPFQKEILAYLNHVADRFDLRKDIDLGERITSTVFDESTELWNLTTDKGRTVSARFCVMATGTLSAPKAPDIPGLDDFKGELYLTSQWPVTEPVLEGKRVAVIGTGSSGVQAVPEIAKRAAQLTVFQRTANFSVPAGNRALEPDEIKEFKAQYAEYRKKVRSHPFAMPRCEVPNRPHSADSPEQRRAIWEEGWLSGHDVALISSYDNLLTDKEANAEISAFVQEKIRSKINDPKVADILVPKTHPYGTKRIVVDSNYFETFNLDHVSVVDVSNDPIEKITHDGIQTQSNNYQFDVIILAIGFDAMTGALLAINPVGRKGTSLRQAWADGPQSYLGLMVSGFPNLFTINGPGSISVLANMFVTNEQHFDFLNDLLVYMKDHDLDVVEPEIEDQVSWTNHIQELAHQTLYFEANSWYVGANVPGKPRIFMPYLGGLDGYVAKTTEVTEAGFKGFRFKGN
jgi:cyclohexanone monooxygenase